jgi:hypothetical protein
MAVESIHLVAKGTGKFLRITDKLPAHAVPKLTPLLNAGDKYEAIVSMLNKNGRVKIEVSRDEVHWGDHHQDEMPVEADKSYEIDDKGLPPAEG